MVGFPSDSDILTMEKSPNIVFFLFAILIAIALFLVLAYIYQKCKNRQLYRKFQHGHNDQIPNESSSKSQKCSGGIQRSIYGSLYDPTRGTNYYSSISFTPWGDIVKFTLCNKILLAKPSITKCWKTRNLLSSKNISWTLLSIVIFFSKNVAFTKFLSKNIRVCKSKGKI